MTGNLGLKVSRDGYDVNNATPLQQVFNSSYNCLKIEIKGDFTSNASGSRDVTVTHSYGYKPAFLVFFEVAGDGRWYALGNQEDTSGGSCSAFVYTTDTDLVFRLYSSSTKSIRVIYFLFVDPGE